MTNYKLKLHDIATIVRSKNAGPFYITFDVMFDDKDTYAKFKEKNILTKEKIKNLYNVEDDDIVELIEYDNARAIKFTLRRRTPCGSPGDTDIYGAQQHVPLLMMEIENH